jgi:hypothetical protein
VLRVLCAWCLFSGRSIKNEAYKKSVRQCTWTFMACLLITRALQTKEGVVQDPGNAPRTLLRDKWLWIGLLALAAVGVALWFNNAQTPEHIAASTAAAGKPLPLITPVAGAMQADAAHGPVPAGLQADEWRQIHASLKDHPQRTQEIARVVGYLQFSRSLAHFQTLRAQAKSSAPSDDLRTLAAQLSDALDARMANAEVSGGEAQLIKISLLEVLQPDAAQRNLALRAWQQEQEQQRLARRDASADAAAQAREAAFQREQAATIAAWSALPEQQRSEQQLEAQLEALREKYF